MKRLLVIVALLAPFCAGIAQQNLLLEDFEADRLIFADSVSVMGKASWTIVNNPVKDKVNPSKKVYRFERLEKMPIWAGFIAKLSGKTDSIDASSYRYLHIKYLRTTERARPRIKLQRNRASREFFSVRPPEKINAWEWITFDMLRNDCKGSYSMLSIQPDVAANEAVGTLAYIDDIMLSDDPEPYLEFKDKVPVELKASNLYSSSFELSWAKVYGATSYQIFNQGKKVGETRGTIFLLSGLKPASTQVIYIVAINQQGKKSKESEPLTTMTLKSGELATPEELRFIYRDSSSVVLRWKPVMAANHYEIFCNGELCAVAVNPEVTISSLKPHTPYVFTVKAVNVRGEQSAMAALTVSTLETKQQRNDRMAWWHHDKFGLFIHWGVYAAFAGCYDGDCIDVGDYGEWIMSTFEIPVKAYKEEARTGFTAANYDPKAWVDLAKRAGMKYIVITSKHHDGFALFDSKASDWNAVKASAAHRDLLEPLVKAAHDAGLKVGFYYSQALDWVNGGSGKHWDKEQDKRTFDEYIRDISVPQVREILKNYGKLDILWWDMPIEMTDERVAKFVELLAEEFNWTKDLVINDRLGGSYKFDHNTPEQSIPDIPPTGRADGRDWETCMTLNTTWGYTKDDHHWKSPQDIIRKITDIVSKGGNFLLNIGPMADGTIPNESVDRLEIVGKWMDVNSEAIYGTTHSPFIEQLPWGRCTQKEVNGKYYLYFHIWDWPVDGKILIPKLQYFKDNPYLLDNPAEKLPVTSTSEGMVVQLPLKAPSEYSITLVFESPNKINLSQ